MSESLNDLEKDIEASRARLDQTIDRIQDRLSVPSIVDDMLGNVRRTPLSGAYDGALDAIRRNPVPVLLIAAGIGWLLHRTGKDRQTLTKRPVIDPQRCAAGDAGRGREGLRSRPADPPALEGPGRSKPDLSHHGPIDTRLIRQRHRRPIPIRQESHP